MNLSTKLGKALVIPMAYARLMNIETQFNKLSPLRSHQPVKAPETYVSDRSDQFTPRQSATLQMAGAGAMLCAMTVGGFMYGPQALQQAQMQAQKAQETAPVVSPVEAVRQSAGKPSPPNAPTILYEPVEAPPVAGSEVATLTQELKALRAELKQMKETQQEVRDTQKTELEREKARRDLKIAGKVGGAAAELGIKAFFCAISDCH